MTAESPSYPSHQREIAVDLVTRYGFRHEFIASDEMSDANYVENPSNRCYFCKHELIHKASENGGKPRVPLCIDVADDDDERGAVSLCQRVALARRRAGDARGGAAAGLSRVDRTFDKIVSIEMFEAVGLNHYDDYFAAVDRLLASDGVHVLQTITVNDQYSRGSEGTADWIEKYIFPGGELASVGEILKSLARTTSLSMYHAENCGAHYARTLDAWRERFHALDARPRARVRRPLHPHVGSLPRLLRGGVPRTPHRTVPAAPGEERRATRTLNEPWVESADAAESAA